MMKEWLRFLFRREDPAFGAEFAPLRKKLILAGLSEQKLRRMDPDERVAALEKARLDPYDYIFLSC